MFNLIKLVKRSNKRVGRGLGSGKGKTAGRGTKGQKARGKVPAGFIGGTLPLYKRLPYRRGLGNPKRSPKLKPVQLGRLTVFAVDSVVDLESLVSHHIIKESQIKKSGVKIVGTAVIKHPLTIKLPISVSAAKVITKMGGKVINA